MLIKNTLKYLPAQVLSPAAQLASMVLWTHWLLPAEMGIFTLITVTQEIAYMVCLGWFSVYALRYLPLASDVAGRQSYLRAENAVILGSVVASVLVALVTAWGMQDGYPLWTNATAIGAFFATRAINMHYGERARAQSAFLAYTILQTAGPVGGLVLGRFALEYVDATAIVLLASYSVAQALGTILAVPLMGMSWRLGKPDPKLLRAALRFGAPMFGLGALGWVAENYIRYVVQWQSGAAALGLMIVGWSLGRRCASVASMLVATAGFPLASRLLNEGRRDEALHQLRTNAALMVAVLLPVALALQFLGPALITLTVASGYRQVTIELLGLSVLGGVLRNLHVHVTDQLMVLDRRLKMVAAVAAVEISTCGLASLLGLLVWGVHGAVIGQGVGSLLTLGISMYWSQRRLGFRWPWTETGKIILASGTMGLVLLTLNVPPNLHGLAVGTVVGAMSYMLTMVVLFAPSLHSTWTSYVHRARK